MGNSAENVKDSETESIKDTGSENVKESGLEDVKDSDLKNVKKPQQEKVNDSKPVAVKGTEPIPEGVTTAATEVPPPARLDPAPGSSCHCTSCFTPKTYCSMPKVEWKHLQGVPWTSAFPQPPAGAPTGCTIPQLDPWNPRIKNLVSDRPWERVSCSGQKTLLYTSKEQLILNTSALHELNLTRAEVVCSYRWQFR